MQNSGKINYIAYSNRYFPSRTTVYKGKLLAIYATVHLLPLVVIEIESPTMHITTNSLQLPYKLYIQYIYRQPYIIAKPFIYTSKFSLRENLYQSRD